MAADRQFCFYYQQLQLSCWVVWGTGLLTSVGGKRGPRGPSWCPLRTAHHSGFKNYWSGSHRKAVNLG